MLSSKGREGREKEGQRKVLVRRGSIDWATLFFGEGWRGNVLITMPTTQASLSLPSPSSDWLSFLPHTPWVPQVWGPSPTANLFPPWLSFLVLLWVEAPYLLDCTTYHQENWLPRFPLVAPGWKEAQDTKGPWSLGPGACPPPQAQCLVSPGLTTGKTKTPEKGGGRKEKERGAGRRQPCSMAGGACPWGVSLPLVIVSQAPWSQRRMECSYHFPEGRLSSSFTKMLSFIIR